MMQAMNDRAGAEEQQGFEERVRCQVEHRGPAPVKPTAMTM